MSITVRAAGAVEDYSPASVVLIRTAIAAVAAVEKSRVDVVVVAGSVEITATVRVMHAADGEAVTASLAAKLETAAQATALLAEAGVVVEVVDAPRTERAWVVFPPDGAPSPPLASPLAPSPGPPTALDEVSDAVGASGSPLSTAVIFGATAIGLGCVLCIAIMCAYGKARRKRASFPASTLAGGPSTHTHVLEVGGDRPETTRVSKSLPLVTELGSITGVVVKVQSPIAPGDC